MMRGCLTITAKLLALVFSGLFILGCVAVLLLINTQAYFFNPGIYKRALLAEDLYTRLPVLVAGQLVYGMNINPCEENLQLCESEGPVALDEVGAEAGPPPFMQQLEQGDWEVILSELLPPELLQSMTESALDQLVGFFDSAAPAYSLRLPLLPFKERIAGEAGRRAVLQLLGAQPACTPQQVQALSRVSALSSLEEIPICSPPEEALTELEPVIATVQNQLAADLPDEATIPLLAEPGETGAAASGIGNDPRQAVRSMRRAIYLSPILPLVLLLLATAFAVRSLKGLLIWWGGSFFLVGLVLGLLALGALPGLAWAVANLPPGGGSAPSGIDPMLFQAALGLGRSLLGGLAGRIGVESAAIALLGLIMILGSRVVPAGRDEGREPLIYPLMDANKP